MKSQFRPTSAEDLNELQQFLREAFHTNADAPFLNSAAMEWKYWQPRGDWNEPRAYVLEREGLIVAHAGIWPMAINGARGVQMIDWASAREAPGAGLALVQKLASMFDFMYSIGGSAMTRKALPAFGFVEYTHQWNAARPLRPVRQVLTHQHRNWKLAPRLVRNFWRAIPKNRKSILRQGWKSQEIAPHEICEDLYSSHTGVGCLAPRSPAFFEYLLGCPLAPIRLYGIWKEDQMKGHFVICVQRGQARIAGVWLCNPERQAWSAAFRLAQQAAKQLEGAFEIVAAGTGGPSEQGASQAGLGIIESTPVYLLNKKGKLAFPRDFQFQLSDDDGFFRDAGSYSYFT